MECFPTGKNNGRYPGLSIALLCEKSDHSRNNDPLGHFNLSRGANRGRYMDKALHRPNQAASRNSPGQYLLHFTKDRLFWQGITRRAEVRVNVIMLGEEVFPIAILAVEHLTTELAGQDKKTFTLPPVSPQTTRLSVCGATLGTSEPLLPFARRWCGREVTEGGNSQKITTTALYPGRWPFGPQRPSGSKFCTTSSQISNGRGGWPNCQVLVHTQGFWGVIPLHFYHCGWKRLRHISCRLNLLANCTANRKQTPLISTNQIWRCFL